MTEQERVDELLQEIRDSQKRMRKWTERAHRVEALYRGDGDGVNADSDKFKILWTITEMQRPLIYDECPAPVVRRRFLEEDEAARLGAQVIERALMYAQDTEGHLFHNAMCSAREDFLIAGRGQVRVVYNASVETTPQKIYLDNDELAELDESVEVERDEVGTYRWSRDSEPETKMRKAFEEAYIEHVCWNDFLHSDGKKWGSVWWAGFGEWLTREDLIEQFGEEIGREVPLKKSYEYEDKEFKPYAAEGYEGYEECARVWEVWNKRTGEVYKVADQFDQFLEEPVEDPLGLEGFFPCPCPIYMIKTTGSLVPVPEYKMYEDQANELNTITGRLERLTDSLAVRGVYDKGCEGVALLLKGRETALIPDENFAQIAAMGGMDKAIAWMPNAQTADVLTKLQEQRAQNLSVIWEIVGLSDILRGATSPRESGKAQLLKYQMVGGNRSRMGNKQKRMQVFARDALQILAEVIAELFSERTMVAVTGVMPNPQVGVGMVEVMKVLRNDKLRGFRLDIETDSTVAKDEIREKEELSEFFGVLTQLISAAGSAASSGVLDPDSLRQFILWGAKRFPAGRDTEAMLEQALQPQQGQKKPSPEEIESQIKMMKLQMDREEQMVDNMIKAEELKLKWAELQQDGQIEMEKMRIDIIEALINKQTAAVNASGGDE